MGVPLTGDRHKFHYGNQFPILSIRCYQSVAIHSVATKLHILSPPNLKGCL